jgi:Domain of unknown function (DUF4864)
MEIEMKKILASLIVFLGLIWPAMAADVSDADKQNFKAIITSQLEAFKADNGPAAYSFAAPIVTKLFPNPEIFMTMVERGYPPVYRNEKFSFGTSTIDQFGRPNQHVTIRTASGKAYDAVYALEKQADGSWKIAGCSLVEIEETGA